MDRSEIAIYQPFFNEAVREYLDPGFIALDWLHNPRPELRELLLHHHILKSRVFERHELTGLVSPKFYSKTGLCSREVKNWILENPGHEIYCFEGRPFIPYTAYNNLERGKLLHPGFEEGMRYICSKIGLDLPSELDRQSIGQTIHCNYWCATPRFWERWGEEIVYPILKLEGDHHFAFSETPYRSKTPVFLIAFIYERMISHFIQVKGIDAAMFPWSEGRILGLNWPPLMRNYLQHNIPWIDETDRRGQWTSKERERLADAAGQLAAISGYESPSYDLLNFDLPARKPPRNC